MSSGTLAGLNVAVIAVDLAAITGRDARAVAFRRGNPATTLPAAEAVRLTRRSPNRRVAGQAAAEERAADLDLRRGESRRGDRRPVQRRRRAVPGG